MVTAMMLVATLVVVALLMLWSPFMTSRIARWGLARGRRGGDAAAHGTAQIFRGTMMDLAQTTVDAAEDSTIRRYRERRIQVGHNLTVSCSRCGISQVVRPDRGIVHFALVCLRCHEKTEFTLPAAF